jgi:hypothetical protein
MYRAKRNGRDRITCAEGSSDASRDLALERHHPAETAAPG